MSRLNPKSWRLCIALQTSLSGPGPLLPSALLFHTAISLCTTSVYTISVYTISVHTVSVHTVSVHTIPAISTISALSAISSVLCDLVTHSAGRAGTGHFGLWIPKGIRRRFQKAQEEVGQPLDQRNAPPPPPQNHGIAGAGRHLWRYPVQPTLPGQGHLEQVIEEHAQVGPAPQQTLQPRLHSGSPSSQKPSFAPGRNTNSPWGLCTGENRGERAPHLPQLVLLLHLAGLVEVLQPGRHVQAALGVLLGVCLRGGQLWPPDGELHAGLLICQLLNGAQQTTAAAGAGESSTGGNPEQGNPA